MTAIGNTREEVDAIYGRTLRILDHEAGMGRGGRRDSIRE
jgi:hypothetical protein